MTSKKIPGKKALLKGNPKSDLEKIRKELKTDSKTKKSAGKKK